MGKPTHLTSGPLWQISVATSREAEEAVAALLERLFGQPASIYAPDASPTSIATVYSSRSSANVASKRQALQAGLQFLSSCDLAISPGEVTIRKVPREDWSESWKKYFHAIKVGSALVIRPSWDRQTSPKGTAVVRLDPGLSFGTGQHPTTAFCLEQLVELRSGRAQSLLDLGTGSGILAIAAAKLGYSPVRATDFDPTAVRVAKANARKNRVDQKIAVVRSDLTRAKRGSTARPRYDVICANLTSDLLIQAHHTIAARLLPEGKLVLAGILARQFPEVQAAYEAAGFVLESTRVEADWQSGRFARK